MLLRKQKLYDSILDRLSIFDSDFFIKRICMVCHGAYYSITISWLRSTPVEIVKIGIFSSFSIYFK